MAVLKVIKRVMRRQQLRRGSVEVMAFCFMPAAQRALSVLFCTWTQPVEGKYYLISDYSVECFTTEHIIALCVAIVVLVFWTVGLPVLIVMSSSGCGPGFTGEATSKQFGTLVRLQSIFSADRRYWYAPLLLRRVLL